MFEKVNWIMFLVNLFIELLQDCGVGIFALGGKKYWYFTAADSAAVAVAAAAAATCLHPA